MLVSAVAVGTASGETRTTASVTPPIDLGTLGGTSATSAAINDNGEVAGSSSTPDGRLHAFLWTQAKGMTSLDTLGGNFFQPYALSETGQVVGTFLTAGIEGHAFSWTQGTGTIDLGTLGGSSAGFTAAVAVNNTGDVVGESISAPNNAYHPFLWTQAGGMIDLGSLEPAVDGGGYAAAVNDEGVVVGESAVEVPSPSGVGDAFVNHAFLWTRAGGMVDLGTLGGGSSEARAMAINESGQIVGASDPGGKPYPTLHAFSWTRTGGMVDIDTLGGDHSLALAVSDSGQVIGSRWTETGATHGFSWTQAGRMVDLGSLDGSSGSSYPQAVSDNGQVVGWSDAPGAAPYHAFSWTQAGGMVDLGTLSGGHLSVATSVNNRGQVVGASDNAAGVLRAVLWSTPVEVPSTFVVTTTADLPGAVCASVCSLRQAIGAADAAGGNRTITFAVDGTFALSGGELHVTDAPSVRLTIKGNGTAKTVIDAGGASRLLEIDHGATVSISGLTLENGDAGSGMGGALSNAGTAALTNAQITSSVAAHGGGVFSAGPLAIAGSIISGNTATHGGGGIANTGPSLVVQSTVLRSNTVSGADAFDDGGGIENGGAMALTGVSLVGNRAGGDGGGIANGPGATATLTGVAVVVNHAGTDGGGIANETDNSHGRSAIALSGSSVTGNSAGETGGGIYNPTGTVTSSRTAIAGNKPDNCSPAAGVPGCIG